MVHGADHYHVQLDLVIHLLIVQEPAVLRELVPVRTSVERCRRDVAHGAQLHVIAVVYIRHVHHLRDLTAANDTYTYFIQGVSVLSL